MHDMTNMFLEGGAWMWAILGMGIGAWLLTAVTLLIIAVKRVPLLLGTAGGLTLITSVVAALIGTIGYFMGMMEVNQALEMADPMHRAELMARGSEIALYPLLFSLAISALPALVGVAGIALAFTQSRAPKSD